jgi:hypothetical protein
MKARGTDLWSHVGELGAICLLCQITTAIPQSLNVADRGASHEAHDSLVPF